MLRELPWTNLLCWCTARPRGPTGRARIAVFAFYLSSVSPKIAVGISVTDVIPGRHHS